ncbi:hypothetical protein D3C80_1279330 [compost metagenome]
MHGAERFLAIDQRLVAGRHRVVLGIADEPRRGQGALVGVLERQGRGDFDMAHNQWVPVDGDYRALVSGFPIKGPSDDFFISRDPVR